MARLNNGLIYTNDNCIGCNRCISGCAVLGANISIISNGKNRIMVDGSKCIHCGHCIKMCKHDAREYIDDTESFFKDLKSGKKISLAVAPSFYMNYKETAQQILGYLKSIGVENIYNVSFGADIATYVYIEAQKRNRIPGAISTSCTAVINFIEKQKPELIEKLVPVKSPIMCLATYVKDYLHYDGTLAFLSPCIAKKDEIEHFGEESLVQYNVTYDHFMEYVKDVNLNDYKVTPDIQDFGFGNIFPIAGGLKSNIENYIGDEETILEMSGVENIYPCFRDFFTNDNEERDHVYLFDALNCTNGCTNGPATDFTCSEYERSLSNEISKKNAIRSVQKPGSPFDRRIRCEERYAKICDVFKEIKIDDFLTTFQDRKVEEKPIEGYTLEEIYRSMHKIKHSDRIINCHSCGYESCEMMAIAVAREYNVISNCVHYSKDENMRMLMTETMTGLPSDFALNQFIDNLITKGVSGNYAIVYFNIKNFTLINEQYGTAGGDEAIKEYARCAMGCIHPNEIVARMGGNNFVLVSPKSDYTTRVHELNSVLLHLNPENHLETYAISIRGGIYLLNGDESASLAINRSAIAFAIARKSENMDFAYFDEKTKAQLFEEMLLSRSMPKALENNEFVVYYQPKVSIEERKLMGAEALVRWKKDDEMVPPMKFIPICEKNGFVRKIDLFVLDCVCRDLRKWIDMGIKPVRISSNFSKQHFTEPGIAGKILEIVDSWKIPHELIEVEFTETAYVDGQSNLQTAIKQLKDFGFFSSMDDFGSGYSSLNLLQNLSFDVLKLDKSLLGDNINNEKTQRVIANVIRMAKELDMEIIAEGVETSEEYNFLRNLKCDLIQGYIFDRPLPEEEFLKRLQSKVYHLFV